MKCKKIFLLFLIMFCCLFFSTNVKAVESVSFTDTKTGITYNNIPLPDVSFNYYVIDVDSNNYVDFFYSNNVISITEEGFLYSDGLRRKNIPLSRLSSGDWYNSNTNGNLSYCNFKGSPNAQAARILHSKENIYNEDGTVFFRRVGVLTQMATIVAMSEPMTIMNKILLILPLILVVVVSYLGLRKAWNLLSKLLHQA